jgi:hypothetical protein
MIGRLPDPGMECVSAEAIGPPSMIAPGAQAHFARSTKRAAIYSQIVAIKTAALSSIEPLARSFL